ncbi:hypothetical protein PDE_01627 [Penicillium oxalicum 114-2]|uniref:Uncharacterized protein n=1 Tax=Penicillium oxalicum (strain 114-2 / CGMCC 5302) TaxID=933388 RepID=S7Z902_PENO1|nr:hypothetical protein PDE_01627 [Penicillium oxalicum 114-2]
MYTSVETHDQRKESRNSTPAPRECDCAILTGQGEETHNLSDNRFECDALDAHSLEDCQSLRTIVAELQQRHQRLEETNYQLQVALLKERDDHDRALRRLAEQELLLSRLHNTFPTLHEGMRDLRGTWERLGKSDTLNSAS